MRTPERHIRAGLAGLALFVILAAVLPLGPDGSVSADQPFLLVSRLLLPVAGAIAMAIYLLVVTSRSYRDLPPSLRYLGLVPAIAVLVAALVLALWLPFA